MKPEDMLMPLLVVVVKQFSDDDGYYSFSLTIDDFLKYETPCKMCLVNPCCIRYSKYAARSGRYFTIAEPCGKFHAFYIKEQCSYENCKRVRLKMMGELVKEES